MSPRKRRREQAFPEDDTDTPAPIPSDEDDERRRAEKEQEAWDAIREAHYEAIEQLPLTLHRQLSLMRQLDEQTASCTASILPALQKYILQRRALAGIDDNRGQSEIQRSSDISGRHDLNPPFHSSGLGTQTHGATSASSSESTQDQHSQAGSYSGSATDTDTGRELLSHVAFMAEELLRASQEKVNLAQANHESVERHIRLLDQAIKEQEADLSANHSRSSNGIAMYLPELAVPKQRRPRGAADEGAGILADDDGSAFDSNDEYLATSQRTGKRKKGFSRELDKETSGATAQGRKTTLTITLPATQQNEELYCYCNRVSFGAMIACDSESCEREWFHLGCVGLTEVPEGEWYCEDCRVDEL